MKKFVKNGLLGIFIYFLLAKGIFCYTDFVDNVIYNHPKQKLVENIVKKILIAAEHEDLPVEINIINTDELVACSGFNVIPFEARYNYNSLPSEILPLFQSLVLTLACYRITVSTSMLNIAEDEHLLAGLLAHEIAHITLGHIDKLASLLLEKQNFIISDDIYQNKRKQLEFEADRCGMFFAVNAGYKASGLREVLNRISQKRGMLEQSEYILTHPAIPERIAQLKLLEAEIKAQVDLYQRAVDILKEPPTNEMCDQSIDIFNKLISSFPYSAQLHNNVGVAYYYKYLLSCETLPEVISYPLPDIKFEVRKGVELLLRGETTKITKKPDFSSLEKARQYFSKAIELDERYTNAKFNLAVIEVSFGNYEHAVNICSDIMKSTSSAQLLNLLGVILYNQNNFKSATEYFCKVIEMDKNFKIAHFNLINIYLKNKMVKEVEEHLNNYKKSFGEDIYYQELLCRLRRVKQE